MLFFRSGERVDEWCRQHGVPRRSILGLGQLWNLAVAWYGSRLSPYARRPQPDEMRQILARIGLKGAFWDPESDEFG